MQRSAVGRRTERDVDLAGELNLHVSTDGQSEGELTDGRDTQNPKIQNPNPNPNPKSRRTKTKTKKTMVDADAVILIMHNNEAMVSYPIAVLDLRLLPLHQST